MSAFVVVTKEVPFNKAVNIIVTAILFLMLLFKISIHSSYVGGEVIMSIYFSQVARAYQ
ncbi:hypothetical protein [Clostridium estertheticum]|uniref:hypothetical protein n=1 Tax=Clostridium estertheticum TaxID=238834 RepID=UPI001C6E4036|nr:hypothetical protein [Clostridium estertheticum]MBW9150907.1 hypothetical protein [Clostridium estertheticum]